MPLRRSFRVRTALAAGAALAGAAAAVGCGVLAGIETFQAAPLDATAADTATGPPCLGFMCGPTCVSPGDPAFGCVPGNACRPCPATTPNTIAGCAGEKCVTSCAPGYLDCNQSAVDGCEAHLATDTRNCGACSNRCVDPAKPDCYEGACVPACATGETHCPAGCSNLSTSTDHCGACDTVCAPTAGIGSTVCVDGGCSIACPAGFGDCNGLLADGCETNVMGSDPLHCGSCAPCATGSLNGTTTCDKGVCRLQCQNGFSNCDGQQANGCECNSATNNCNNNVCTPCKATGVACAGSNECCGYSKGAYCQSDESGNYTTCISLN